MQRGSALPAESSASPSGVLAASTGTSRAIATAAPRIGNVGPGSPLGSACHRSSR